jgi:hypothetical protein
VARARAPSTEHRRAARAKWKAKYEAELEVVQGSVLSGATRPCEVFSVRPWSNGRPLANRRRGVGGAGSGEAGAGAVQLLRQGLPRLPLT